MIHPLKVLNPKTKVVGFAFFDSEINGLIEFGSARKHVFTSIEEFRDTYNSVFVKDDVRYKYVPIDTYISMIPSGTLYNEESYSLNINQTVKVKLKSRGYESICSLYNKAYETIKEEEDEEGYYEAQLWGLMKALGPKLAIGFDDVMETHIIIKSKHLTPISEL